MQTQWHNIIHFATWEFICPCCKEEHMDWKFIELLDHLRSQAHTTWRITSGWRCKKHNKRVGGHQYSQHMEGTAADIYTRDNSMRADILRCLLRSTTALGIGIYDTHIHVQLKSNITSVPSHVWIK